MTTKTCTRCGDDKVLTEFHKNSYTADGRQNWCKACITIRKERVEKQPCVYFLEAEGLEMVKVGLTNHLSHRLQNLKTGCPVPLKVAAVLKFDTYLAAQKTESWAKRTWTIQKSHGEWYRISPAIRKWLTNIAALDPRSLTDEEFEITFGDSPYLAKPKKKV